MQITQMLQQLLQQQQGPQGKGGGKMKPELLLAAFNAKKLIAIANALGIAPDPQDQTVLIDAAAGGPGLQAGGSSGSSDSSSSSSSSSSGGAHDSGKSAAAEALTGGGIYRDGAPAAPARRTGPLDKQAAAAMVLQRLAERAARG